MEHAMPLNRISLTVALMIVATPAMAGDAQPAPNPEAAALGQMVLDAAQREAALRVQLIAAQAKVAAMEAAAKPATPATESPK
jgi:hypothetical protein